MHEKMSENTIDIARDKNQSDPFKIREYRAYEFQEHSARLIRDKVSWRQITPRYINRLDECHRQDIHPTHHVANDIISLT